MNRALADMEQEIRALARKDQVRLLRALLEMDLAAADDYVACAQRVQALPAVLIAA
jgi:hypothetical protein